MQDSRDARLSAGASSLWHGNAELEPGVYVRSESRDVTSQGQNVVRKLFTLVARAYHFLAQMCCSLLERLKSLAVKSL